MEIQSTGSIILPWFTFESMCCGRTLLILLPFQVEGELQTSTVRFPFLVTKASLRKKLIKGVVNFREGRYNVQLTLKDTSSKKDWNFTYRVTDRCNELPEEVKQMISGFLSESAVTETS